MPLKNKADRKKQKTQHPLNYEQFQLFGIAYMRYDWISRKDVNSNYTLQKYSVVDHIFFRNQLTLKNLLKLIVLSKK